VPNQAPQTTPAAPKPHNRLFGTERFELDITRAIGSRKFSTSTAALVCVIACGDTSQLADFHFERTGLLLSKTFAATPMLSRQRGIGGRTRLELETR